MTICHVDGRGDDQPPLSCQRQRGHQGEGLAENSLMYVLHAPSVFCNVIGRPMDNDGGHS